ncbi:MAG: Flagellar assembly protein FliH/Type secretion system HrpE [Ignavibacteria bacterium]|nr:Flagellar assembly protein FliH/Type secretion system HrpE [Ignavibacteria bacterium]
MAQIILKIPRRKFNKIDIIRSAELLAIEEKKKLVIEKAKRDKKLAQLRMEMEERARIERETAEKGQVFIPTVKERTHYVEHFTISDSNQPIEIALDNILDLSTSLDEIKLEIQNAYEKGFKEGKETTNVMLEKEINRQQEWIRNIDNIVVELKGHLSDAMKNIAEQVPLLSIMAARHILEREISDKADLVIEQVRKAIFQLDNEDIFKIRLNPQDIDILTAIKSNLLTDKSRMENVVLAADDSVERGSCMLETSVGFLDATIGAQLENIKGTLAQIIKEDYY